MTNAIAAAAMTRLRSLSNALRLSPLAAMLLALLATLDVAALVFAIGAAIGADGEPAPPKTDWRPPNLLSPTPNVAKTASGEFQALSRPIFWKSRRAAALSAQDGAGDGRPRNSILSPAGFSLEAIVKAGAAGRAFIVSNSFPGGQWLVPGEKVEGWTIVEIRELELTLIDGERSARLPLYPEVPGR